MIYRYRCNHRINGNTCGYRKTLPRKVEEYARPPKCRRCGTLLSWIDKSRDAEVKRNRCYCDGLPFTPHRKGSRGCVESKLCDARMLDDNEKTVADFNAELGVIRTIVDSDEAPF